MNSVEITVNTTNTNKVAVYLLSILANLNYGKATINKYDRIGVVLEIEEIEIDCDAYDELIANLRFLHNLDDLYKDRIDTTLKVDIWGNEHEYGSYYNNDWCGGITFEEWGDLDIYDDNDDDDDNDE